MGEWFSASDLAGLPGMPGTVQRVNAKAKRETWTSRPRSGKGGGLEYHMSSLPQQTQNHLIIQALNRNPGQIPALIHAAGTPGAATTPAQVATAGRQVVTAGQQVVTPTPPGPLSPSLDNEPAPAPRALVVRDIPANDELKDYQRQTRDGRLALLALVDELTLKLGSQGQAVTRVLAMAQDGTLPSGLLAAVTLANARGGAKSKGAQATRTVSRPTLYRYLQLRDAGIASGYPAAANALAPRQAPKRDVPTWAPALLAIYQDPLRKPSLAACHRQLAAQTPAGVVLPSLRTVQEYFQKLPEVVRSYRRQGTRARRAVLPFTRRSTEGLWPMDVVAVDGHAIKGYVQHPLSGEYFHPEVTTYIDIATRVIVGWSAWLAESQYTIWLALRGVVLDPARGIPAIQYSDNGAYTAQEHQGVLARLGITPTHARAYNPQANGVVERVNKTLWGEVAKALFPTGKQVDPEAFKRAMAQMKKTGAGLPTWDEFRAVAQTAINTYNATPHASLKRGRAPISPNDAWAAAVADGWTPTLLEGDALHDLLPAEERVCRRGEVVIQGRIYFHRDLADFHGATLRVGSDPADGSRVWVSEPSGRLICVAVRDGNTRHYIAEDKLQHAQEQRRAAAEKRVELKLVQVRTRETPVIEGETYTHLPDLSLPRPGEFVLPAVTLVPALPALEPVTPLAATLAPLPPPRHWIDNLDNDATRYEAFNQIKARQARGEALDERETAFYAAFADSDYRQTADRLWDDWERQCAAAGI